MPGIDTTGIFAKRWDMTGPKGIPSLSGKVAIVTGGNTGIGFITCQVLASKGATVYMFSRSQSRAQKAIDNIKKTDPAAQIKFIQFDLTSILSCREAAADFLSKEQRLDILINNAGIMMTPYKLSVDGIELQACNGVGHYALTMSLLPILKSTAAQTDSHVRIVNVSSDGQDLSAKKLDFASLEGINAKDASPLERYGNSKLMNVLFTDKLQEELEGTGIRCISIHPGAVRTELTRGPAESWPWLRPLVAFFALFFLSPRDGALTQLYAATSPSVDEQDLKGVYLIPFGRLGKKAKFADDKKLRNDFWDLCARLVAEKS